MTLLRIYFDVSWYADYLVGCDIVTVPITFADALMLEMFL